MQPVNIAITAVNNYMKAFLASALYRGFRLLALLQVPLHGSFTENAAAQLAFSRRGESFHY
jgi:hypothetical protein